MSLSTTQYGYIIDPMVPFTDDKGKTIKNGFIRVFMAGTSTPVITYRNYDGATNQEKIELDNSGRVMHNVIGSKGSLYKVVVYNILHSQENPLLTVDKIAVLGASVNASGATIVTGLDSVTVQEENFLKATVEGTGVELALDPTEVTSEVSTIGAAETAAPDYVVPLLDKTGTGDSKKILLANLFKFALDWISRLATTISSFASGDFIAVSNTTNGTRKMSKDTLLELTAQNALAGNVAPAFDPTRDNTNPYKAGESVTYGGKTYTFKVDHYGAWDANDVRLSSVADYLDAGYLKWESGYYNNNGNLPSKQDDSSYKYAVISVLTGCKVYVKATLSATVRPWFCVNRSGFITRRAESASADEIVEIADGEERLYVQCLANSTPKIAIYADNGYEACTNILYDKVLKITPQEDKFYNCSGDSVPANTTSQNGYKCGKIFADVGDTFYYIGLGSSTAKNVCTFDANLNFVRKMQADYRQNKLEFTIESGEVGFVFNYDGDGGVWASNISIISRLLKPVEFPPDKFYKVDVPSIAARKKMYVQCGQQFYLRCKVKYPKTRTRNPASASTVPIGEFAGVLPQLHCSPLIQRVTNPTLPDSTTITTYWPTLAGGIIMDGALFNTHYSALGSDYAFGVQYTGNGSQASISNDGTTLTLTVDGVDTTFTLANYNTMDDLYTDISQVQGFTFKFCGLEGKTPADLVIFTEVKLVSNYYGYESPEAASQTVYSDNGVFFVPYADESWHNFEVVCTENKVYSAVDGVAKDWNVSRTSAGETYFDFYGHLGFVFKDIEIFTQDSHDVEVISTPSNRLLAVSEFSPLNVIFEGHGILNQVSDGTGDLDTTSDRMFSVFSMFKRKGYVPVTMDEVIASYNGGKPLPKRSFTIMFDDYRFNDVLNIDTRRALLASGVKLNLAVITNDGSPITYEGESLTMAQAVDMLRIIGGDCYTHTKNHTNMSKVKLSETEGFLRDCIKDADLKGVKSSMIVYPFGYQRSSTSELMNYLGIRCGLNVGDDVNFVARPKYNLRRVEIGERENWSYLESWCL